ncbi:MAG: heavy metal-associated domain-containing protein [Siculibacillus sp.]
MITVTVEGMTCGGCVESVKRAVLKADPSADVAIDLDSGRVDVTGALDRAALTAVIEATGFDVKP